eukprot:scaffold37106_cov35-Prasinocladus_malaysianus.AAC.1
MEGAFERHTNINAKQQQQQRQQPGLHQQQQMLWLQVQMMMLQQQLLQCHQHGTLGAAQHSGQSAGHQQALQHALLPNCKQVHQPAITATTDMMGPPSSNDAVCLFDATTGSRHHYLRQQLRPNVSLDGLDGSHRCDGTSAVHRPEEEMTVQTLIDRNRLRKHSMRSRGGSLSRRSSVRLLRGSSLNNLMQAVLSTPAARRSNKQSSSFTTTGGASRGRDNNNGIDDGGRKRRAASLQLWGKRSSMASMDSTPRPSVHATAVDNNPEVVVRVAN